MKILLTIHEKLDPNSGSAGSTFKLGQEYKKLGHEVFYYSFDDLPNALPPKLKEFLFPEFVANKINQLITQNVLNIVDASTGDIWFWTKVFRNSYSRGPIVITRSHGLEQMKHIQDQEDAARGDLNLSWKYPLYRGSLKLWEVEQSISHADSVFLLNKQEKNYVVKHFEIEPEKTHVFPNGIPDYLINLPFKTIPKIANTPIRIAQISTYIPRKGIRYSAPAINDILLQYPKVEMSFFGTDCQECHSVDLVYKDFDPRVRDRITVLPRFDHHKLPELLEGYQIKLLPSLSEGFGKALIEAMACGLAPITTATAGPLEIVTDRKDGLIVPPRDTQGIKNAISELINDHDLLQQLRQNAYHTAQQYGWNAIANSRLSVYEKNLTNNH